MKIKKFSATMAVLITLSLIFAYTFPLAYSNNASGLSNLSDSMQTNSAVITYTCPMHPEIMSDKPGQCPKCGMDLILKDDVKKNEGMKCLNMDKCKEMGCNMDECKGESGGCTGNCPMMENKEHDHKSNDNDDNSNKHQHKSGCQKKGC